jgi:hypothetical protein
VTTTVVQRQRTSADGLQTATTTRDAAQPPSPHAGWNWNLHRMGRRVRRTGEGPFGFGMETIQFGFEHEDDHEEEEEDLSRYPSPLVPSPRAG